MASGAARTVPLGTLLAAAGLAPFRHFAALLRFGLGPLLIAMILWPPAYSFRSGTEALSLTDGTLTIWDLFGYLAALPVAAAFAAPWNRLLVTGEEVLMGSFTQPFDRRTWQVAWAFIRLQLVLAGAMIVALGPWLAVFGNYVDGKLSFNVQGHGWAAALPVIAGMFGTIAVVAWLLLRFSLTIPAAAMTGTALSLRASWTMSRPIQFHMLGAFLILLLVLSLVTMLLLFALVTNAPGVATAFYAGLPAVFMEYMLIHAFWAGLLGRAYRAVGNELGREEVAVFE
jgi:hypothetical protein